MGGETERPQGVPRAEERGPGQEVGGLPFPARMDEPTEPGFTGKQVQLKMEMCLEPCPRDPRDPLGEGVSAIWDTRE